MRGVRDHVGGAGRGGSGQGDRLAAAAGAAQGDGSLLTGPAGNPLSYPPIASLFPSSVSATPLGAERRSLQHECDWCHGLWGTGWLGLAGSGQWERRVKSCVGGGKQYKRLPDISVCSIITAFGSCTARGYFTSTDVMRLKAVSMALWKEVSHEFYQLKVKKASKVIDTLKSVADNANCGVEAVSGSFTAASFLMVLDALEGGIEGKCVFDAGCGCGTLCLIVAYLGGRSSGVDTVNNLPVLSRIFLAGRNRLGISPDKANIGFSDLSEMISIPHNPDLVFAFWDGVNPDARDNVVTMTSKSETATVFACSNAPGETIDKVCSGLNATCTKRQIWAFADNFQVSAIGGMQRQVWIFKRNVKAVSRKAGNLDFPSDIVVRSLKWEDDHAFHAKLRQGIESRELSIKEFIMVGQALLNEGFSNFQALSCGGFGRVYRANHPACLDKPCVLKIGIEVFSDEDMKNDSIIRECAIMSQLDSDQRVSANLLDVFGGISALAKINLGAGRSVSALCMQFCWGDCSSLKAKFRDEFLSAGAQSLSLNCCLFFQKTLHLVSFLHEKNIAHNDLKWANILLVDELLHDKGINMVLADFGISCLGDTQYVTALPKSIPKPTKQACSNRAISLLKKALEKPISQLKKALEKATVEASRKTKGRRKKLSLLTPVTEAMMKKIMNSEQLLLLSTGTPGYRNEAMVNLSHQKYKKPTKKNPSVQHEVDFGDVCKHDVRSVATMICEVMRTKTDGVWARGRKCCHRQYELELNKLTKLQEVSDFLLKEKSVPLCNADKATQLLCNLVYNMLRSDSKQLTAREAANHSFFSFALDLDEV